MFAHRYRIIIVASNSFLFKQIGNVVDEQLSEQGICFYQTPILMALLSDRNSLNVPCCAFGLLLLTTWKRVLKFSTFTFTIVRITLFYSSII